AVSNLDEESKWTVHYTAPWHQQENVFLPGSRPPCVEDLHRQAKVNLKTALRECDKLRKDGFRSSQYYSQGPTFADPAQFVSSSLQDDEDDEIDKKSIVSSMEDDKSQLSMRPQTPQGDAGEDSAFESQAWRKAAPLPTPEEKMRQTAKAVPTDIVPINITGKGNGGELRPHSMFLPGQYSTLGRVGSVNSALRRSLTRDSSCQTEEVKVVPPSMRRIRAQRGQGIAAQMAGISASSSTGSISVGSSDSSGFLVMPHHFNGDPSRFHSLPRPGARVSLSADPIYSSTPIKTEEQTPPQRPIGKLQFDDTVVHMRASPRTGPLPRPKSQELRGTQTGDWDGGLACVVSPHASYSTSVIPNATLCSSAEVVALKATGPLSHPLTTAYPTARPLSLVSSANSDSATSSLAAFSHSATCPALAMSTPPRTPKEHGLAAAAPASESGHSDSSVHSHSTLAPTPPPLAEEQWIYDTPENVVVPHRSLPSSCSTPINQLYSSQDLSSRTNTDSSSLYSQDNDGYYTSMHMDSGLRSRSHGSGQGVAAGRATRHSMYECRELAGQGDSGSLYSDRSLSRSISLRKSKKPPLPPARTDSLRRKPGPKKPVGGVSAVNGAHDANGAKLSETLIASLQQSLQIGLGGGKGKGASPSSPSHSPSSDYDDPWLLRPRSQSSISAGSSVVSIGANASCAGVANVYSLCHVTPTHSETSSLRSDYADSWGYYTDYPHNQGDHHTQNPPALSGGVQNGEEGSSLARRPSGLEGGAAAKAKASSPERLHRLTSPSSGYSSQSNTPTAGTPVPSLLRSMSPSGGRPRPKVPERKSSLLSSVSVSSSSTSLSSNTSDSLKSSGPPPPPPPPLCFSSSSAPSTPLSQPPPFPPPLPPSSSAGTLAPPDSPQASASQASTLSPPPASSTSPEFPPPPSPEMLVPSSSSFNGSLMPVFAPSCSSPSSVKAVKEDPKPSLKLLITPLALQSIQLRSVKRPGKDSDPAQSDPIRPPDPGLSLLQDPQAETLEPPTGCPLSDPGEEPCGSPASSALKDLSIRSHSSADAPSLARPNGKSEDQRDLFLNGGETVEDPSFPSPPQSSQSSPAKQKPPAVSKKPQISFVPPFSAQLLNGHLDPDTTSPSTQSEDRTEATRLPAAEEEEDQRSELQQSSESWTPAESPLEPAPTSPDPHLGNGPLLNGETLEEGAEEEENSSIAGSLSLKEDDSAGSSLFLTSDYASILSPLYTLLICSSMRFLHVRSVFAGASRPDPAVLSVGLSNFTVSFSAPSASGGSREIMVTPSPSRARTTEDLFAAIHRSKRKVLGRKESEEDKFRAGSQPQSPPATPTGMSPGSTSPSPRQTGSIQRNLRKSSTSSDTFKALLLKKGSRSETSFRMSATEMLRSTDPRFHRTRSESELDPPASAPCSLGPHSPSNSPSRGKRALDEWNRYEVFSLSSPTSPPFSMSGLKYGRSRTPPSAASSKYNARCRILSSPMTVICEREGELTE
uniref:NHS like 1 n=1 Tax=Tetraodon nigroviridis TaxID=99883 RepID=H3DG41_TETNG